MMEIKERYIMAIEVLGLTLLVSTLIYGIGIIPTIAIITSVAIIFFAQIVKAR